MGTAQKPQEQREAEAPAIAEWIVAAIGLALLLATLGYLVHDAWKQQPGAPQPSVRVQGIDRQREQFLVRVEVANGSGATAAALRVRGELRRGAEVVEHSEIEFQHVPGHSRREGGLFFSNDPRTLQLVLSARSYEVP